IYFEAGDDLWLITISRRSVRLRALPNSAAEIRRLADQLAANPENASLAASLGEILLPSGTLPQPGGILHIVAAGIVRNLPFSAVKRLGRYLVEDYAIVLLPSLSALAALESQAATPSETAAIRDHPRGALP